MAKLEVQIGADSSELNAELAAAESKIERLSKIKVERVKLGLDTKTLDAEINKAKQSIKSLKDANTDLGKSFDKAAPKIANGGNTLMQFSRIAQDAPFGIIGIGNNLTATAESFGYLSKSAGGAGNALKAIGSSILGTGGILLGVSLLTTGLTYLAQNGLTINDVFNRLNGTFDENKKLMNEVAIETAKNSQAQITSVGAYVSAAKNINLSMEDRLIAVKKLQDEYPAYFGNLTKEEILNGNIAKTVRQLTLALIAKAKAAALTDRIVKLAEEEEAIQQKINASITSTFKFYKLSKQEAFDAAVVLNKQLRGEIDLVGELNKGNANNLSATEKTALAAFQYSATLRGLSSEIQNNRAQQDRLTAGIERQTAAQIKLDQQKEKSAKTKTNPVNVTPQVSGIDSGLQANGLVDVNTIAVFNGQIDQFGNKIKSLPGVISTSMGQVRTVFSSETLAMLETMQAFNDEMNNIITSSLTDTFNNLGNSIGEALANGTSVLGAIGNTLIQSMGKFLSDMGGLLIKYGTLAVTKGKIDLALANPTPGVAIAAGLAAIAVGVALKAASGAIGARATGGSGSRSVSTGADYSSPSTSSVSSSSFSSGGTVVFEIDGQKLVGVLSNTLNKNTRLGGKLSIG